MKAGFWRGCAYTMQASASHDLFDWDTYRMQFPRYVPEAVAIPSSKVSIGAQLEGRDSFLRQVLISRCRYSNQSASPHSTYVKTFA